MADEVEMAAIFRNSPTGSGLDSYFPDGRRFSSHESAAAAWPRARRSVWLAMHRFTVPAAARFYDGLTNEGRALLWRFWADPRFDPAVVWAAVDQDTLNLRAFMEREPRAATELRDVLIWCRQDLETVRGLARECAASALPARYGLRVVHRMNTSTTYGDGLR